MNVWTAFAYFNMDPISVHCTHKYLGDLSFLEIDAVTMIIDRHLKNLKPSSFSVRFDKEAFFGYPVQTRVLVPSEPTRAFEIFSSLRFDLNAFRKDDWTPWKPHITTPSWSLAEKPFTRYILASGDKILKEWSLEL